MRRLSRTHKLLIVCITAVLLIVGATWVMGQDDTAGDDSTLAAGGIYTVRQSDVLDLIAAEFDVQTGCLAQANELTSPYELHIGQTLRIDFTCPRYDGLAFVVNPREDASDQGGGGDAGQGGGTGGANTYVVQRGDVLDLIAAEFDVQTGCLANANELTAPYRLSIGQTLTIDLSCPRYTGDAPVLNPRSDEELGQGGGGTGGANTYVVQRGDVLDLIAAQFDVQTGCLANANELTAPYALSIGQTLNIDLSCPRYDGDAFVANPRSDEELGQGGGGTGGANTYRVQRGDVLDLIAAQFDVQTGCLAQANELTPPYRLHIGQTLNIDMSCPRYTGEAPVLNPRSDEELGQGGGGSSATSYVVQRGDVLDLIALDYNLQASCLAAANGLEPPYRLDIGQTLAIDRSCPPYDGGSTPPLNADTGSG